MRKFTGAAAAAAVIAAILVVVVSAPAGAGVAAKNTKFCKAVASIGDVSSSSSSGVDTANLKQVASSFKKAGNAASGKVKSAMKTLASKYASIADAKGKVDQAKAAVSLATDSNYRKAFQTFITYYTKNCAAITVPTT
jgi:hypothetical protein